MLGDRQKIFFELQLLVSSYVTIRKFNLDGLIKELERTPCLNQGVKGSIKADQR